MIGSISRGTGYLHKTVNDYVRRIEYVDANGVWQTITSPDELSAAAGCFGLLGIITHVTLEVNKMSYAVMQPRKIPPMLAIPPPDTSIVPEALHVHVTDAEFQTAVAEFEERAEKSDYAEWSWFPYQSHVFVNTWKTTPEEDAATDILLQTRTFLDWLSGWLVGIISSTDFYADIPARWQAQLVAMAAMAVMPPTAKDPLDIVIKTAVPNAQQFRRDCQYLRVRDLELEIPIPAIQSDPTKPDWTVVRRLWWEMISLVYSSSASPLRLSLEMRIMGDSNIIMAPQRGNTHGTVVIEVGTVPDVVRDEEWGPFCQQVLENLRAFAPEGRVRPHWGKEWYNLRIDDMSAQQYLKTVSYKTEIAEFKEVLGKIGKRQGWNLKDLQRRFSNRVWDEIIFGVPDAGGVVLE